MAVASEIDELVDFLSAPSAQLRKEAVEIVKSLTGSEDGLQFLTVHVDAMLNPLVALLLDPEISHPAAEALINLSQDTALSNKLVALGAISTIMEVLYKSGNPSRLLVMLLANLTQVDAGVNALLQVGDDKMEGLHISKLVRSFCRSSSAEMKGEDTFDHVASVLVNISKVEVGRRILLDPKRGLLKHIACQFDFTNSTRKKGVFGTIRNCCFEADNQLQNLLLISEFLWPALLLPVAGKKVYSQEDTSKMPLELGNALSHEREAVDDPEIRIEALEAIYLISLEEAGRRALWSVNGPRILQIGYEDEEDPKVMEAYESVGSLLVSNGGSDES